MRLKPNSRRSIGALLASLLVLAGPAAGALAAGSSLTVEVKGQYAKLRRTACHKTKSDWKAFHRASTIEVRGFLVPPPAAHFPVEVRIEKCVAGHWRPARRYALLGENATDPHPGRYKAFYRAAPLAPRSRHQHATVAYYRAKAYAGSTTSEEKYFLVTSG